MALRHILCAVSTFLLTFSMYGQGHDGSSSSPDEKLDRYELLCGRCLELKTLVAEGGQVSRTTAAGLIDDFLSMNREIKDELEAMSPAQKSRFEMINHWFSTGMRPMALDNASPLVKVSPASGTYAVRYAGPAFPAAAGPEKNPAESMSSHRGSTRTVMMAGMSAPVSYSLTAGIRHIGPRKVNWGGYMRLSSNFRFTKSAYDCLSDGTFNNGTAFWGNGNSHRTHFAATLGALVGPLPWLDIHVGAGYGRTALLWQDIEGSWASVRDFTHHGATAEAGIITYWRSLCLGVGVSTISFRTVSLDVSLGFALPSKNSQK